MALFSYLPDINICFFAEKTWNRSLYRILFVFLQSPNLSLLAGGVMDDDILESVIDALFLTVWTTTIKSQSKTNAEVNATGVVYTPGVCRGLTMPSRTLFGCTIYLPAWVFRLCSFYWEGCGRPKRGTADEDTPLFICHLHKVKTILASGYQSGTYCHWLIWSLMKKS